VNQFRIANAATGNNPTLIANGSNTNIGITLTPKGTGNVLISNSSFSGGLLQFGGTTSAFPALLASGSPASLASWKADNSGAANFLADTINANTGLIVGNGSDGTVVFRTIDDSQVTVRAHGSFSPAWTLTLPADSGALGQMLSTNGFGTSSWSYSMGEIADTFNATSTWSLSNGVNRHVTLTGNISSLSITNIVAGMNVVITVIQGSGGSHTISWPGNVKWTGGVAPTLTTAASSVDVITLHSFDGSNLYATSVSLDVK
jgi:hypothetical protein